MNPFFMNNSVFTYPTTDFHKSLNAETPFVNSDSSSKNLTSKVFIFI